MKAKILPLVLLVLATAMPGCAQRWRLMPQVDHPTIEVSDIRLVEQTEQGARVEVTLTLQNPNDLSLPMPRYRLVAEAGGQSYRLDEGLPNRALPPNGVQTLTLPAAFATGGDGLRGATCWVRGAVTYQPPGQIRERLTDAGLPLPSVSFDERADLQ